MDEIQYFLNKKNNMTNKELKVVKAKNAAKGMPVRLRDLRKENSVTQKELAKYIGCTAQAISAYETGANTPDPSVLRKYAEKFKVSGDYLLGITDTKDPELNDVVSKAQLSEKAIEELHYFMGNEKCHKIMNKLFEDKEFYKVLGTIVQYVYTFDDLTRDDFDREELYEMYNIREWVLPKINSSYEADQNLHKTDILMYGIIDILRRCMDKIKNADKDELRSAYVDDITGQLFIKHDFQNPERRFKRKL